MTAKEEVASSTKSTPMEPFSNQAYAEWAAAYQAYYGNGASTPFPCFYPPVAGPQSQPYHWGGQHLMGPYGNPAFPPCPYPYGYVHPTMASGAMPYNSYAMLSPSTELVMAAPTTETDAKSSLTSGPKQTNGSFSAMAAVGNDETRKATSGSECGMGDFSSDRSEEEGTPNEFETTSRAFNTFAKGNCGPGTFTNTATEYWSQSTPIGLQGMHGSSDLSCQPIVQGQDRVGSDIWSKDDKETKRQKRKQSNRESARRSRLRKQAECGDLSTRVDSLMAENTSLRAELDRLSAECKKLATENEAIMRSMQAHKGGEANELSDRHEAMQSEDGGFVGEETSPRFKGRTIFHIPHDLRTTTLHDLGACALSLMRQADSIAAS